MKPRWMKIDDAAVLLVFACPACGLAETMNPSDGFTATGTPVCPECVGDMDYTHTCVDLHGMGEVCADNDGQAVIYTGRHVAGRSN